MRPIKFRGVMYVMYGGNEKVYGDLVHENGHTYIINAAREHHRVYENTVAQLVGYDTNGKEVYEGDILQMDWNGVHYEYKAQLIGSAVAESQKLHA